MHTVSQNNSYDFLSLAMHTESQNNSYDFVSFSCLAKYQFGLNIVKLADIVHKFSSGIS